MNDYLNAKKVVEESEETDGETEDSEEENTVPDDTDVMTIVYKGTEYHITDTVTINNVIALLS